MLVVSWYVSCCCVLIDYLFNYSIKYIYYHTIVLCSFGAGTCMYCVCLGARIEGINI